MGRNPLLDGVFFLVIHLYHRKVRNKMLHLDRPQKLSNVPSVLDLMKEEFATNKVSIKEGSKSKESR